MASETVDLIVMALVHVEQQEDQVKAFREIFDLSRLTDRQIVSVLNVFETDRLGAVEYLGTLVGHLIGSKR
jgi:hypothetical protein